MKREELKRYTSSEIEEIDDARLEAPEDGIIKMTRAYIASEADSVMESYEKRIKELESQLENVQASMYAENVDANMALVKANERIKELEAEVKKWKQDNRYLSAFIHLLHKGEDANSTAIIDVANRIDKLEAENARLRQANFDTLAHFNTLKEDYEELKKQVPVWHKLDKPLYVDENGNDMWDLPVEDEADTNGDVYTIHKCGARGTEPWDEIDPEVIAMWCELPTEPSTTEESSATEKENG